MNWFGVAGILFGLFGLAYAARLYLELRKWAHLVKYARIVIAYKGKVKLNAPLQEWALWCKMAEQDKSSNGRVVYMLGGTRVAILRKSFVPDPSWKTLFKNVKQAGKSGASRVREGVWSAEDETKKVS